MKKAYEYFSAKRIKPAQTGHSSSRAQPAEPPRNNQPPVAKKDDRQQLPAPAGSSVPNSLKNSKQGKPAEVEKTSHKRVGIQEPNDNSKFNRAKSYGNLSGKPGTFKEDASTENEGFSQNDNSPRFLQINLKMFNNYMTNNNPQNVITAQFNMQQDGASRELSRDPHTGSSKSFLGRDASCKLMSDRIQQQQLGSKLKRASSGMGSQDEGVDWSKFNISADMIAQIHKKGILKNMQKLRMLAQGVDYVNLNSQGNEEGINQAASNIPTARNTVYQGCNDDKKRPVSELNHPSLYAKCLQNLQNQQSTNSGANSQFNIKQTASPFNLPDKNAHCNSNRMGSYSSCSLLQGASNFISKKQENNQKMPQLAKNCEQTNSKRSLIDQSQKNHITVLVSMLDEKNKYIKVLHKKIDKLNDVIQNQHVGKAKINNAHLQKMIMGNNQSRDRNSPHSFVGAMSEISGDNLFKRAKSVEQFVPQKQISLEEDVDFQIIQDVQDKFDLVMKNLDKMKYINLATKSQLDPQDSISGILPKSEEKDSILKLGSNSKSKANDSSSSSQETYQPYGKADDSNYVSNPMSQGAGQNADEQYQDFLNNADLDPVEDQPPMAPQQSLKSQHKKNSKSKHITNSVSKQKKLSHGGHQKNASQAQKTGRSSSSQQQFTIAVSQTPVPIAQKHVASQKKNPALPSHRPPTSQASYADKGKLQPNCNNKSGQNKTPVRVKKSSLSTINDNSASIQGNGAAFPQTNFMIGGELAHQQQLHQFVDQINIYKQLVSKKEVKIQKHKDFIEKLKLSLQNVLTEHKKQEQQLACQSRELKMLKQKLGSLGY